MANPREFFKLLVVQTNHGGCVTGSSAQHVTEQTQRCDAHRQAKLEWRLAVLTVLSAILLPLTLNAGTNRMNLDKMPVLHYAYS